MMVASSTKQKREEITKGTMKKEQRKMKQTRKVEEK
jgi:hypothetical protein